MALTKWAQEYEAECRERAMIWRGGKLAMQAEGGDFGDPDGYDREGLLAELDATRASLDDERERAQHNMDMAKDYTGELWSVRGKRAEHELDATRARVAELERELEQKASWLKPYRDVSLVLAATQAERDEARALASDAYDSLQASRHTPHVQDAARTLYALLARPVGSVEALKAYTERAIEATARRAAKIAEVYEQVPTEAQRVCHEDCASAAILNELCDPDDPDRLRLVARLLGDATPEREPEPVPWRCQACGAEAPEGHTSHGRADHAPNCDGSCRNCPVEVECGPCGPVGDAATGGESEGGER